MYHQEHSLPVMSELQAHVKHRKQRHLSALLGSTHCLDDRQTTDEDGLQTNNSISQGINLQSATGPWNQYSVQYILQQTPALQLVLAPLCTLCRRTQISTLFTIDSFPFYTKENKTIS